MSVASEADAIRTTSAARPRARWTRNISAKIAAIPMVATALVIFLGGTIWTVVYSFTNSKLLSTVQMPGGVPVATVAIGKAGAKNAGYLAAQILAVADDALAAKVKAERQKNAEEVIAKDAALQAQLK